MNKEIIKVLIVILGIVTAIFGLLGLYLAFVDSPKIMRAFHGMHFILICLAFPLAFFSYRQYRHLLK